MRRLDATAHLPRKRRLVGTPKADQKSEFREVGPVVEGSCCLDAETSFSGDLLTKVMGPHKGPSADLVVDLVIDLKEIPIESSKRPQGVGEVTPVESGILLCGEFAELPFAKAPS